MLDGNGATIGLVGGLAVGILNFWLLMRVAHHTDKASARPGGSDGARILRWVAWADLALFPAIGYVVGPIVLG